MITKKRRNRYSSNEEDNNNNNNKEEEQEEQEEDDEKKRRKKKIKLKNNEKEKEKEMDEEERTCAICFDEITEEKAGYPDGCTHVYHYDCIMQWSKTENTCPYCKCRFNKVGRGDKKRSSSVKEKTQNYTFEDLGWGNEEEEEDEQNQTVANECYICNRNHEEAYLLLCDGNGCRQSAHTFCLGFGKEVPEEDWYCTTCEERRIRHEQLYPSCSGGTSTSTSNNNHNRNTRTNNNVNSTAARASSTGSSSRSSSINHRHRHHRHYNNNNNNDLDDDNDKEHDAEKAEEEEQQKEEEEHDIEVKVVGNNHNHNHNHNHNEIEGKCYVCKKRGNSGVLRCRCSRLAHFKCIGLSSTDVSVNAWFCTNCDDVDRLSRNMRDNNSNPDEREKVKTLRITQQASEIEKLSMQQENTTKVRKWGSVASAAEEAEKQLQERKATQEKLRKLKAEKEKKNQESRERNSTIKDKISSSSSSSSSPSSVDDIRKRIMGRSSNNNTSRSSVPSSPLSSSLSSSPPTAAPSSSSFERRRGVIIKQELSSGLPFSLQKRSIPSPQKESLKPPTTTKIKKIKMEEAQQLQFSKRSIITNTVSKSSRKDRASEPSVKPGSGSLSDIRARIMGRPTQSNNSSLENTPSPSSKSSSSFNSRLKNKNDSLQRKDRIRKVFVLDSDDSDSPEDRRKLPVASSCSSSTFSKNKSRIEDSSNLSSSKDVKPTRRKPKTIRSSNVPNNNINDHLIIKTESNHDSKGKGKGKEKEKSMLSRENVRETLQKLYLACKKDKIACEKGWPMQQTNLMISEIQNIQIQSSHADLEVYLENRLLKVLNMWISPFPNDNLQDPDIVLIILRFISTLQLSKKHLQASCGLGLTLVQLGNNQNFSKQIRTMSRNLVQSWQKYVYGR